MQMISNQANQDYSQAALSHFADNETKFGQTHKYDSLAQFDRNWNAQRNPPSLCRGDGGYFWTARFPMGEGAVG